MRWLAPDGTEWDSKFEYEVFLAHKAAGIRIRRCGPQDSVAYARVVRNGVCGECGSDSVSTTHSYTPDLSVDPEHERVEPEVLAEEQGGFSIECKGYLRAERRSLLRALLKARPDLRLRFIVQRDYKVTKQLTITGWISKFLKCPVAIWTGQPPATWRVK